MKKNSSIVLIVLFLTTSLIPAQKVGYTKPSGYVKHTVSTGLNLIGLTLNQPIILNGVFGQPSGGDLPTDVPDLSAALGSSTSDSMVLIEVTAGDNVGTVIEALSWSDDKFTGFSGLDASLDGDSFQVRMAPSISGLFGANNSAGFLEGDLQTADVVWIADGSGGFKKYFYSPGDPNAFPVPVTEGWKSSVGVDATNVRFNYMDGMFIQRRGSTDLTLVFTGAVKTIKTILDVKGGDTFNYYSGIYPVGTTLTDSKLDQVLTHGDLTTGDVVWMPNGVGAWKKYVYQDADPNAFPVPVTEGWKDSVGVDASDVVITSGFIIQRRGSDVNAPYEPNELYDNL